MKKEASSEKGDESGRTWLLGSPKLEEVDDLLEKGTAKLCIHQNT